MDRALARRDDSWPDALPAAKSLANDIYKTEFVPRALRGNGPAVLACVMTGRELGLGPMQSLQSIHVVDGRPTLSAELMRALVLAAGHRVAVRQMSPERCVVWGRRADSGDELEVEWTMEQARTAGVAGKLNWRAYPDAMLLARSTSALCRALFPDVLAGVSYTPDELDHADGSSEPVRATAEVLDPEAAGELDGVGDAPAVPLGPAAGHGLNEWLRDRLASDELRDRMRAWWRDNDLPVVADSGMPDLAAVTVAQRAVIEAVVEGWITTPEPAAADVIEADELPDSWDTDETDSAEGGDQ